MNEMRIYIIMRDGLPLVAYSSPVTASLHLMREQGLRLKSVIVQDMQGVPLGTYEQIIASHTAEDTDASDRSH